MGITGQLARRIVEIGYDQLDAEVVRRAKQAILDGLAVAVAGSVQEAPTLAAEHVRDLGGLPVAGVWGFGFKTSPVMAAYVNGISTHVLDYEPMWSPPTHPVSPTVPVAFALAESRPVAGKELLVACVKGWEMQGRLRVASCQHEPKALVFHPPGVVGVMGAAVVASHLLGLDEEALRHALGIAASRAGGLIGNVGSMVKSTHCGLAGAMGLDAALLASRGLTANPDILEAPKGFVEAFFPEGLDFDQLLMFGRPFRIVEPGLAIKLFPCQYATHFAITAALELHTRLKDPCKIASVTVIGPVMPYVDRPFPKSGLEGKFSFQYTTAAALLDGRVGIATFSDERRFRSDMEAMLPRVRFVQSPDIPATLEHMFVRVIVELEGDGHLEAICHAPRGFWGQPLSDEEHLEKVRECLAIRWGPAKVDAFVDMVRRLEVCGPEEVRDLASMLTSPGDTWSSGKEVTHRELH